VWRYALFGFDPSLGQDLDEWRDELPEKGWKFWWIDGQWSGALIHVDGRNVLASEPQAMG